jgi:predicted 3-demethylubiquinone-9 3-methyltransferase (glyoxalase superfamily)
VTVRPNQEEKGMQKITSCLWFDGQAEEAARFYTGIFKNSRIKKVGHAQGKVLTVQFTLEGQEFLALNGGPLYKFTPAISLIVNCKTQKEVDRMWDKLSAGGREVKCGWVTDKFGVSWQVVPTVLGKLMSDPDPARSGRVMQALLQMEKLDIKALKKAYAEG